MLLESKQTVELLSKVLVLICSTPFIKSPFLAAKAIEFLFYMSPRIQPANATYAPNMLPWIAAYPCSFPGSGLTSSTSARVPPSSPTAYTGASPPFTRVPCHK